jgi:hypothetical protein
VQENKDEIAATFSSTERLDQLSMADAILASGKEYTATAGVLSLGGPRG